MPVVVLGSCVLKQGTKEFGVQGFADVGIINKEAEIYNCIYTYRHIYICIYIYMYIYICIYEVY